MLNGNNYENQYVFVLQVDGDKVRFLREYIDSAYAHSISAGSGAPAARKGTSPTRSRPWATTRRCALAGATGAAALVAVIPSWRSACPGSCLGRALRGFVG